MTLGTIYEMPTNRMTTSRLLYGKLMMRTSFVGLAVHDGVNTARNTNRVIEGGAEGATN